MKPFNYVLTVLLIFTINAPNVSGNSTKTTSFQQVAEEFKSLKGNDRYEEFLEILNQAFVPPSSTVGHAVDFYKPNKIRSLEEFSELFGNPNAVMQFNGKETAFYELLIKNGIYYYGILILEGGAISKVTVISQRENVAVQKERFDKQQKWLSDNPQFYPIEFSKTPLRIFGVELGSDLDQHLALAKKKNIRYFSSMNPLEERVGSVEFTKPLDGSTDAISVRADIIDDTIYRIYVTTRTGSFYDYLTQEIDKITEPVQTSKEEGFSDYILHSKDGRIRISIFGSKDRQCHIKFTIEEKELIATKLAKEAYQKYREIKKGKNQTE